MIEQDSDDDDVDVARRAAYIEKDLQTVLHDRGVRVFPHHSVVTTVEIAEESTASPPPPTYTRHHFS